MVVGEIAESIDLLVIGGGPGGYTAALEAAALGRTVTLVDRDGPAGLGGVCLRVGCIPSKALIEVAELRSRYAALAVAGLRGVVEPFDMGAFQAWKDAIVARLTGGVAGLLKAAGVTILTGGFRFLGARRGVVDAGGTTPPQFLEFTDAVIATGSTPRALPRLVRDGVHILDSTDVLGLTALPSSVAVVGGGYIGVELGTALRKLGSAVTIVEAQESLLPGLPSEVVTPVRKRLSALGVDVRTGTSVAGVEQDELVLAGAGAGAVPAEVVVVAIGRRPNTDDLGLADAGIQVGADGLLAVGPDRIVVPHIAAIGDVTAGPALAHKATAEARVAVAALSGRRVAFEPATIPMVVYSDPEIAITGAMGIDQSRQASVRRPFAASGRALTTGDPTGFVRMAAMPDGGPVTGVHIVGPHASELISEAVLAIEMAASPEDVWSTIHPHPTLAEAIADVALDLRSS
ncbi:dihydrolipoyl dehydrogenase [Nakamurella sp. YIM 132087]|uniref:Dihydrolipoyl dehydrogenase n=1 Tax=Nakamurella alba TaxID=2665158 RepID=A0A7K1FEL5_9ACTN|nr:FAD-dependent oxidoreductase [Nakamurella alba]MTD12547.1 dihydrolipoyl dehydrogenase [Nakamurella alba]